MTQETITNCQIERIPLKERVAFQSFLLDHMIQVRLLGDTEYKKMTDEDKENTRHNFQMEWQNDYSEMIHKIIDDKARTDNAEIRALIMKGQNKEASIKVLEALEVELEKNKVENSDMLEWVSDALELEKELVLQ